MNEDLPHRAFRFIEVLAPEDLKRSRGSWSLVRGWLELAEEQEPGTPKALLEGDSIVRTKSGTTYKEVSYKTEHASVERALDPWARNTGRRWARYQAGTLYISDGHSVPISEVVVEPC